MNGFITKVFFDGAASIEGYDVSDGVEPFGNLAIPSELDFHKVTHIGTAAFFECTHIKKVTISDGVKVIGKRAFCGCIELEKVEIPDSVTTIEDNAFSYCNIASVTVPADAKIADTAFPADTIINLRYKCKEIYK